MLRNDEAFTEIQDEKLIDIEIGLANAWTISKSRWLAAQTERASTQVSRDTRESTSRALAALEDTVE
jgi:hypothetical protein